MKPGDKCEVIIDGVEYELANGDLTNSPRLEGFRILIPKPQKSELEKFIDKKCSNIPLDDPNESYLTGKARGMKKGAFALLEYLENAATCLADEPMLRQARKWCGK